MGKIPQIPISLLLWLVIAAFAKPAVAQLNFDSVINSSNSTCRQPVLSSLQPHRVAAGETLDSIALKYNLLPETLIRINPSLKGGSAPVGEEIMIPPFDGIRVEAPAGSGWKDLAATYGISADLLFELNGCQKVPKVVFIPGVNWNSSQSQAVNTYTGVTGYPLPSQAAVGLAYGWQRNSKTGQTTFHSGIDLLAEPGTSVLAVEAGVVAFAGEEGNYGNLVVVDHGEGLQSRYGQLETINVRVGEQVKPGDVLATVGSTGQPDIDSSHLHFEVRYQSPLGWVAQDPEIHIKPQPTAQQ